MGERRILERIGSISQHLNPSRTNISFNACLGNGGKHSSYEREGHIVIIGGLVLDIHAKAAKNIRAGTTTPGQVTYLSGGVSRNVAECMQRLGVKPFIISVVGEDMAGKTLLDNCKSLGLSIDGIRKCKNVATPVVSNIFDSAGEIAAAVADVQAVEESLTAEWINQFRSYFGSAPLLMIDANLHPLALEAACNLAKESNTPVWFEPVSFTKSARVRSIVKYVTFVSPNESELIAMAESISSLNLSQSLQILENDGKKMNVEAIYEIFKPAISILLDEGIKFIVLTLGSFGVFLCFKEVSSLTVIPINASKSNQFEKGRTGSGQLALSTVEKPKFSNNYHARYQESGKKILHFNCLHFPALPASILCLTGAGDCFVGGTLAALCVGKDIIESMAFGVAVAKRAVESELNVPSHLSLTMVSDDAKTVLSLMRTIDSSFH